MLATTCLQPWRRKTVLLLHPHAGLRTLLAQELRRARYEVIEAGDGLTALREGTRRLHDGLDALITTQHAACLPGAEVARRLHDLFPRLQTLVMGNGEKVTPLRTRMLPPPFSQSQFIAAVKGLVKE